MEALWVKYWGWEKQYGSMIMAARAALERSPSNNHLRLLYGTALALYGKFTEAITTMEQLLYDNQISLAAALALSYAHNCCEVIDKEAVFQLDAKVKDGVNNASELAMCYAADFLFIINKLESALDYTERVLINNPNFTAALIVKGWILLNKGKRSAAADCFKAATSQEKQNIEAVLGEVKTLPYQEGITRLNQLIVRFPKVTVPLIEKAKLLLAVKDWTQALDTATRVLSLDQNNMYALQIRALHQICVDGHYEEGALSLRRLVAVLEKEEPTSYELPSNMAKLFSCISGRNSSVLNETYRLAERVLTLAPHLASSLNLIAHQSFLRERYSDAAKYYRNATKLDDSSVEALTGLTVVQMAQNGPNMQVQQQVEFLIEVGVSGFECEGELLLLRAQCDPQDASNYLDHAFELHKAASSKHPYGLKHLTLLNPYLLMRIANKYPNGVEGSKKSIAVLKKVVEACPGLVDAQLSLAKRYLSLDENENAINTLRLLLDQLDPTNIDAHLIMAQLNIDKGKYDQAESSLERALSFNLEVREKPWYHLLLGTVHRFHGDHESCINSLKTALSINNERLSFIELGNLYLEMSGSLMALGQLEEAGKALQDAGQKLRETHEEGRVTIASAELALLKHDPTLALTLLSSITPKHPFYIQARMKMADIHLHEMKDGRAYAECFRQLVETNPSTENLIMLGDAYLAIQEPEQAVETYELALRKNPKDASIACKLGKLLVKTHQYGKAIKSYREAGLEGSLELAELLLKLGQTDHANAALKDLPLSVKAPLLAKVREKSGDIEGALQILQEVQEQMGRGDPIFAAKLCHQMAEYATMLRNYDSAISHYKRSLLYKPNDSVTQIALAKLYMQVNDWNSCQTTCSSLLNVEPNNEPALLMLADLAFRRVDFVGAGIHFAQLLSRRPAYWVALARLIEVKRRTAQLPEARGFLEAAAAAAPNQPGLSYCTGLYDWYSGNTNSALHHFNCARNDPEWGQQALHNMVEICLCGNEGGSTAMRLLKEMKPHSPDEESNVRLLTDLVLLTSKEKSDIDQAMNDLTALASQETLRVGATLGLATGYIQQKQIPRARNVLKRVAKTPWQFEEAEYLERCWLLLADLHVQAGKHDQANELLRRVLTHNHACYRAHELLGLVAEKEQKYMEAGSQYQLAWKLGGENDPSLGFKLAFNLVKGKRYAEAITTCQAVLHLNSDYPRIRKEVLEKAITHLRT
ncbi:tetratricopeptide repeat protein 21B isoform X2 [Lycorma delicatula]|uniref:tetratricopeptide repeat protein 21B isoform X2 n=1 Tax=Lycorma delicatula TaxID=130591 RepID=UPI003F5180D3